jgi:MYXO-CTERM domain-containing protein
MGVIGTIAPEPPPWAMMAMGAVVLIGVRQLRRKKA